MVQLSKQALSTLDKVDLVTIDVAASVAVDECNCIFKSLLALLTPTLDIGLEEMRGRGHT